jgi:hypothetical protein
MRWLFLVLLVTGGGCTSLKSRYAMSDPVYADKYEEGAERGDLLGKAKQALDARHTQGLVGPYVGGGAQVRPRSGHAMGGAALGVEGYATSWLTGRGALSAFVGPDDGFLGVDLGVRLQTPTRLAPFVGLGTFNGVSRCYELADRDGVDNDDDGWIDESGEEKKTIDGWLSSLYPEAGAHWWINGDWRVTAYGRYLVTTEGRDNDDWLLGLQITSFAR